MIKHLQTKPITAVLFAFTLILTTLSACKKDKNDDSFTASITATVDGTPTVFDKNIVAATITSEGHKITSFQGTSADGSVISISLAGNLSEGKTYSNNATDDDDKPLFIYNIGDEDSYLNDDSSVSNAASVTLSTATSTAIKGTFTGDLVQFAGTDSQKKVITDGKFSVKLDNQVTN